MDEHRLLVSIISGDFICDEKEIAQEQSTDPDFVLHKQNTRRKRSVKGNGSVNNDNENRVTQQQLAFSICNSIANTATLLCGIPSNSFSFIAT